MSNKNCMMKQVSFSLFCLLCTLMVQAQDQSFKQWALTPPMGWNSYDCYGSSVVESEVRANADYMAKHLKKYGWEYIVIDIRWFVENDKAGGYNQIDPRYAMDGYGRYTPALNRFPSAAKGAGFKPLADYLHGKGLKFGIHLMRGLPKIAAKKKLPVLGADGITCDMICNNDSACGWLKDNYKVDCTKHGAQEYYNSCFNMYAQWGVDYVKVDDICLPYHKGEIEMIRHAIDQCGRNIVLSLSPGAAPIEEIDHLKAHANLWRTTGDFWDNWPELKFHFSTCAKWAPYIESGNWADADMLPLGKICIRGIDGGGPHWCALTKDEQITMMTLWYIAKAPLMFGGDLPQNDKFTNDLLTNKHAIYIHNHSVNNRVVSSHDNQIIWSADTPKSKKKYVAVFNTSEQEKQIAVDLTAIGFDMNRKCKIVDIWTGKKVGIFQGKDFRLVIEPHASRLLQITPCKITVP